MVGWECFCQILGLANNLLPVSLVYSVTHVPVYTDSETHPQEAVSKLRISEMSSGQAA